ncbi:hypothetical protein [Microbacter margulisiae]|uniref:Fibronectin type-III domain-containing protein n=1 Tax=Microbacter margulisiae TaxID=1350067 RepID=A0A7W5H3D3_9PORP|nr:hypothetical protein [Microbacter margulisiae]MBB3188494.1 hypothetical protein [Microbacter margulisiae]
MKKIRALYDFIRFPIPVKITFCSSVLEQLTGNILFPEPDVPLAEAKTKVDKLNTTYLASKDGSHTAVSAMHDAEEEVDYDFRILAAYVNRIANGDETAILSSGFHIMKQPVSIQKPVLAAIDGDNSGYVYLIAKAVSTAGSYIWQMAKDKLPETEEGWSIAGYSTQAYFQVKGLDVAARYYFRMAAITPTKTTDYTPAVMKVVM